MTAASPREVVVAIKDWGVDFRPYPFDDRAWGSFTTAGGWDPIGIMHHHTTGPMSLLADGMNRSKNATLRLLRVGRPDLGGPLCHFSPVFVGKGKLVVYGIGAGNVNHAGMGRSSVADQVRRGRFNGNASGRDDVDGNVLFWGLEYMHPGLPNIPWPDELLEAGHRTAAAICEASGWSRNAWPGSNVEHREWTSRKPDRSWDGWGDGMRKAIKSLADSSTTPEIDGWVRNKPIKEALHSLVEAAKFKDSVGRHHQAGVIRQHIHQLRKQFPVK